MHSFNLFICMACCLYLIETAEKNKEEWNQNCTAVVRTQHTVHTLDELLGSPRDCMFYPSVSTTGCVYGHIIQLPALVLRVIGHSVAGSPVK